MDWIKVGTIVGVNIGLIAAMITIVVWAVSKMDSDMKSLGNRMDSDMKSMSTDMKSLGSRLDGHATRIDQLYRMFVDLLKEGKK